MATVPNPALGRSIGACTITPQTQGATGALTPGTLKTITTQLLTYKRHSEHETEEISAVNTRTLNEVITGDRTTISMTGFLFANDSTGTPTNWLKNYVGTSDLMSFVMTLGGLTETIFAGIKSYEDSVDGKGKITFSLETFPIDAGVTNPAFS